MNIKNKHTVPGVKTEQFLVSILQRFMTNAEISEIYRKYTNSRKPMGNLSRKEYEPTKADIQLWRDWVEGNKTTKDVCRATGLSINAINRRFSVISRLYLTDKLSKYE